MTVPDAVALEPANRFGEVWVVANGGAGASGFEDGALVMTPGDRNPERILIDLEFVEAPHDIEAGTRLGSVTGVMTYAFGNYRVQATSLQASSATPVPDASEAVTIGVYNVENLDPTVEDPQLVGNQDRNIDDDIGDGKFAAITGQIVADLGAPAIVALQEVQDNDGVERTTIAEAK